MKIEMSFVRAILVWFAIMLAETVHGILRGLILQPLVGDFRARQICVFTGMLLIYSIIRKFKGWINVRNDNQKLSIGIMWALFTICFEIGLGRLVGFSWERILEDYNLFGGGFMVIGLLFMACTLRIV